MSLRESLAGKPPEVYGDLHAAHSVEIYKLCVEMADRISSRRQAANSFFLTINTAVVALVGYIQLGDAHLAAAAGHCAAAIVGMVLCLVWRRLIASYRGLNSAKFKVIHEIEATLPLRPFEAEWDAVGRGKDPKLYRPFTQVEGAVPWVFFAIHFALLAWALATAALCLSATNGAV